MLLIATLLFGLAQSPTVPVNVDAVACAPRLGPSARPAVEPLPTHLRLYPMPVEVALARLPAVCSALSMRGRAHVVAAGLVVEDERDLLP